jgi:predicted ATPase/Tfp pilus assembly protein PilF
MLTLHLLGGFQVKLAEQALEGFATDKARALLAYLAVERDRPHRRERLASLLWPDLGDERARQSLRQALSHLKQTLGSNDFLLSTPQDVQIHPQAEVCTDVGEIQALAAECERHRHRRVGGCLPCLQRQQRLLARYPGEFLAGFPAQNSDLFEEWVTLVREKLHLHAMQALSTLADYYQQRGEVALALHHAREQIRLEPWREESHRQAMRLLALNGERSAALAQYETCCRALAADLDVEPSAETKTLYTLVKNGALPAPKPTAIPPDPATAFIGRTKEQSELAELLADPNCRLVTLLGPGGMGKTHLALQVARGHAGLYADGIYFVPLAGIASCAAGLAAIADALGLPPAATEAEARLNEALRKKEILIVLDNFEHLIEGCEVLGNLLQNAPRIEFLVTSRERLRLREEWVYDLEGLSYPAEKEEAEYLAFDALALFEQRAAQVDRRFRLTPALLADATRICQLVDGLPLAVELAASAVAERSCAEIASAIRQTFDALAPTLRNFPERHRSLRAVFEHSWNLLDLDEQTRLTELSVFIGGFSAEAALRVAETSTAHLADLAAKSLLRRDLNGRYALHETIRQFAAEKLEHARVAQQRHTAYYARWTAGFDGAGSAEALEMLWVERANLRSAWEWSLGENDNLTASLLPGLSQLFSLRGPLSEGESLFCRAIEALRQDLSKIDLTEKIKLELARIYNAQTRYAESIALARSVTGSARALLTEGQALSAQGEGETARPVLEKALALARELDDKHIEADCLRELGNIANRTADYGLAVPLYQQSLALARELDDKRGESATLNNWATVEWDLGELDAALAHYLQALALYRELGNRLGEARALNNLSNVLADQGDLAGSLEYSRQALDIHREMGNPRGQSAALNNLGATYFSLGQFDAARKSYQQALAFFRESGNRQAQGETLANLSLLDCVQGNLSSGRENGRVAIALAEQAADKVNLANACYYLGRIELADGNFEAAELTLQRALDLRREVPHLGRIAEIQAELARLAGERGDLPLAQTLIEPILALIETPGALDGTDEPDRIYALVAQILAVCGSPRAEIVRQQGLDWLRERAEKISQPALQASFKKVHSFSSSFDITTGAAR